MYGEDGWLESAYEDRFSVDDSELEYGDYYDDSEGEDDGE